MLIQQDPVFLVKASDLLCLSFLSPSPTLHLFTFPALTGFDACGVGPIFASLSSPSLAFSLSPCMTQSLLAFVFPFSKVVLFQFCFQIAYSPLLLFLNLEGRTQSQCKKHDALTLNLDPWSRICQSLSELSAVTLGEVHGSSTGKLRLALPPSEWCPHYIWEVFPQGWQNHFIARKVVLS